MKKHSFQVEKRRVVFSKGPIHLVDCEVRMPSGKVLSRQILEHPGAVVIIPKIGRDQYLLIRQFRFAVRDWLWEVPAGGIEPRESIRKAAERELIEETGYRPRRLRKLLRFYPTPGVSGEIMHLFLAESLTPAKGECDEDEEIEMKTFTFREVHRMIRSGKICDAKTILSFFYLSLGQSRV